MLEPAERRLLRNGEPQPLTPRAFQTLLLLVRNAGHIVPKDRLLREVWAGTFVEEGTVTQNVSVLRKALGDAAYIETVPKSGYRFAVPVREVNTAPETSAGPRKAIAVMPLVNLSGDQAQEYFADGMSEALIASLARIGSLRVVPRSSVARYKGARRPLAKIAAELAVGLVLEGSVIRDGDRIRITAELVDASANTTLWAESYDRDLRDVLSLQAEVARRIAREIEITLTPQEERRLASSPPVDPEAYDAYLKGRYYWNKRTDEGFRKGLEYFEEAMRKDTNYAVVYARVADCYTVLGSSGLGAPPHEALARAKASALKALDIDDTLAEAHASLAFVKFRLDWDWEGAEREFRRAIELNPVSASTHHLYALYLSAMERHDEAIFEIGRAQELDPLTFVLNSTAGRVLQLAGRVDDAADRCRHMIDLDPDFVQARTDLGLAQIEQGRFQEGIAELETAASMWGRRSWPIAALGYACGRAGARGQALKIRDEAMARAAQGRMSSFYLAVIEAGLGDYQQALRWLDRAYEEHSGLLVYLRVDPVFDPLRPDSRFATLVRRVGLP